MSDELAIEYSGNAMIVRFTRPRIRNPLSVTVLKRLHRIMDECSDDNGLSAVVLTGSADVFASGADLREIAEVTSDTAVDFAREGQILMSKIASLPQRTIAAINGYCFGGALDLALACDKRIASPNAKFAHPGTGLGIITGWGGTQRLPKLIGEAVALEMLFTATPIHAERALHVGLIDVIDDEPLASALSRGC